MFETLTEKMTTVLDKLRFRQRITEKNVDDACSEVRTALLEADVHFEVARDFVGKVREDALGQEIIKGVEPAQHFVKIVHDRLVELLGEGAEDVIHYRKKPPTVIVMAGLQGSGKTTTAAKLARLIRERDSKNPMLVAADIYRPAAVDQLKILGEQLSVPVFSQQGMPATGISEAAVDTARTVGNDVIIIDTAGRLHIDEEMMQEVEDVCRAVLPQEIFLVVDAMTGQDAANSARAFNERLEISGVILTKLDSDARGGAALSIRAVTGKPIRFAGVGEKLDALEAYHGDRMAGRILGMGDVVSLVEKAQEVIDQDEALKLQKKLLENRFTLNDLLDNLRQVKRMGSITELLGHLPGIGGRLSQMNVDEGEFKRLEAMISSMTLEERDHPEIIDYSRKWRVAKGSGTAVGEVNALLKQYQEMKKLFGGKGGLRQAFQGLSMLMSGEASSVKDVKAASTDKMKQLREDRRRKRRERKKKRKKRRR